MKHEPLLLQARRKYHKALLEKRVLTMNAQGIPSNADSSNAFSVAVAKKIVEQLTLETQDKVAGQTSGNEFENINRDFVTETFLSLQNIKPGNYEVIKVNSRRGVEAIAAFEQYSHLADLARICKENPELAASLGNEYTISPDVVIMRHPLSDEEINSQKQLVDMTVSKHTALRAVNGGLPLLHASISSKWTIRSDRAQNSRAEALNLIRNRKGHLPHIVVVTAEPTPSRLASIALGTGDIDCVYHFALDELIRAVTILDKGDSLELLKVMIDGKRLKDISDLPLDLAV